MAVSVRSASAVSQGASTHGTASLPAGTQAGDLLIAIHGSDRDGSISAMTAPSGWTAVGSDSRTGVGFMKVWTKTATDSEPTSYTFPDSTSADSSLVILAVAGHNTAAPLAVSPVFDGSATASTSHTAPSVVGVADGLLITGYFASGNTVALRTHTPPAGMTEHADTSTGNHWTGLAVNGLELSASGATGAKTATANRSDPWTALSLVVAPASTSPTSVSFRGATEDARGTTTQPVPALPAGTVSGDLLVAVQASDLNGSLAAMTAEAGWTERGSSSRSDVGFVKVWTRVATSSEPASYTFTDSTSAHSSVIVLAVTGQDPTAPLAVTPTFATGASATSHPAPSVAGVAGGMLVCSFLAGVAGTSRSYTPPSGMTEREESALTTSPNIVLELATLDLAAAGQTGTKTATCSGSAPYVTMSLIIAPITTAVTVSPATAVVIGSAVNATVASISGVSASHGSAIGSANNATISSVSRTTAIAGRGSATGAANNATVTTSSSTSTTVTAGATASGMAYGSNTGAIFGFDVAAVEDPGAGGLFPSETLFPSEGLFPSAGGGATAQTVSPTGIDSTAVVGAPAVTLADGPQDVIATSIGSTATIGVPTVTPEVGPQDVVAVGIDTTAALGRPTVIVEVAPPPPTPVAQYLDTYYVDGIDLAQYTTQIEIAEGLADTPGAFGDDVVLPGRDGLLEVWGGPGQQRRPDGPGKWVCSMWLLGVDPVSGDLLDPADSAAAYQARWDELVRMFHRRRIVIDHPRQDGTRRAVGYLTPGESMTPTDRRASPWFGRFKASVTIPAGHWVDQTEVTTGPTTLANNGVLSLSPWAGATAPCTELTITFGPGNNPRLSTSYGFVGWNGTIAPGRQLTIDTSLTTNPLGYGAGQVWTPDYGGLVYSPGPRLFEIDPSEPLQAVLTHTGGGSMSVEVAGRRRYRTS